MKPHPLKETYERSFGKLNEGTAHNQVKYNMTTIFNQLQKLNQHVQANPEFKHGDPIKSGMAGVITAFNTFFESVK